MTNDQESRIRNDLISEVDALEKRYQTIKDYLNGAEMEVFEVVAALKAYRDDLNVASAHILTFYVLKGQKAKITWDSLLNNIQSALDAISASVNPNSRAAIIAALNMSEPKAEEVMSYLAALKKTL